MAVNDKKAGGYKAALMANQPAPTPVAAAHGLPPVAIKTPNQANQGMPAIQLGGQVQVENLLSAMQMHKKAKEEEFRRAQEEEDKLASLLLEVQARFPGKKMMLVDEGADLVQRSALPPQEPAPVAPVQRQENGYHERPRWTPASNWDQVDFVINGLFEPFVCRRNNCPNRGEEFWGNVGQVRKRDCKGCNRPLTPIKPEEQVGYPLYLCPDKECAYMWACHKRSNLSDAPLQDCPICGDEGVPACRLGNDRLLAAWLVKGALNEWYAVTDRDNYTEWGPSSADAAKSDEKETTQ